MDYDEAVTAFYQPTPPGTVPEPTTRSSLARRLRDAIEPIAMHPVWSRGTNEALAGLGLDFLTGYAWGRAAALGEPSPGVVVATFEVFEPGMISGVYDEARRTCGRQQVVDARAEATTASLRAVLDGADVTMVADRLRDAALAADGAGRPLYSGLRDVPIPDDPVAVLWRSAELIREHRGDSHIAACVAAGLEPIAMSVLTELWVGMPLGSYSATRGWSPDAIEESAARLRADGLLDGDALAPGGRALRDEIEDRTDRAQHQIVDRLGDDTADLLATLSDWSDRCVAAGAFPPDAYKRAAG